MLRQDVKKHQNRNKFAKIEAAKMTLKRTPFQPRIKHALKRYWREPSQTGDAILDQKDTDFASEAREQHKLAHLDEDQAPKYGSLLYSMRSLNTTGNSISVNYGTPSLKPLRISRRTFFLFFQEELRGYRVQLSWTPPPLPPSARCEEISQPSQLPFHTHLTLSNNHALILSWLILICSCYCLKAYAHRSNVCCYCLKAYARRLNVCCCYPRHGVLPLIYLPLRTLLMVSFPCTGGTGAVACYPRLSSSKHRVVCM